MLLSYTILLLKSIRKEHNMKLEDDYPDLIATAQELKIDVDKLEGAYSINPTATIRLLEQTIRQRQKESQKLDHIAAFYEENQQILADFFNLRGKIESQLLAYNEENNTRLVLDCDADEESDLIFLGRAPKGSVIKIKRDLQTIYTYIYNTYGTSNVYLNVSENEQLQAELKQDGTILYDGKVYKELKHWTSEQFTNAVQRGTRTAIAGSPWRSVYVKDKRGLPIILETIYKRIKDQQEQV